MSQRSRDATARSGIAWVVSVAVVWSCGGGGPGPGPDATGGDEAWSDAIEAETGPWDPGSEGDALLPELNLSGETGEDMGPPLPLRAEVRAGSSEVVLDAQGRTITLTRDEKTLLRLGPDGLALGRVDALEVTRSYDPWTLYPASGATEVVDPPAGLAFLEPVSAEIGSIGADRFEARLFYPEGVTALLSVVARADDRFEVRLAPETQAPPLAYVRIRAHASPDEGFYGLGGWHDHVNHRGRTRALQIEIDLESESANNEGHVRIPLLTGTSGWGLFVDSLAGMVFDVATQADDLIEVMVGTGEATRDGLAFYLLAAAHPLDIPKHYYDLTGAPRLPAPWALGPWVWRDEGVDQAKVIADLEAIRDHDLATTGYWIDRPYASAVNSFDFEPSDYDDPAAMVARAHALGFRMALWHAPYVDPKDPLRQ